MKHANAISKLATFAADSYDSCVICPNALERWDELVIGKRL